MRSLGAGGMGEVWAAERIEGGFTQRAAVKLVRSGMSSLEIVARFRTRAPAPRAADHAAIARLLDGGVAPDGRPWFAMERVDGEPITDYAKRRALPLVERLRLLVEVARAVDAAHRSLVVHRDLKPSNILVTSAGEPKLLDFGLAKLLEPESDPHLTRSDMRALTPAYAAPEQVLGEPVTMATDVYALGVLLYELITGELPHVRRSPTAEGLAEEISRETIERPSSRVRRTSSPPRSARARRSPGCPGRGSPTVSKATSTRSCSRRSSASQSGAIRPPPPSPTTSNAFSMVTRWRRAPTRSAIARGSSSAGTASRWPRPSSSSCRFAGGLGAVLWQARATRIEAARTARVRDFLASIFGSLDPDLGPGRNASAATLLADGAARVETELGDEPRIAAELYAALGRAWLGLDRYDEAERLARRSFALATTGVGADSILAASSLAFIGEIATAREDLLAGERDLSTALDRLDIAAARGEPRGRPRRGGAGTESQRAGAPRRGARALGTRLRRALAPPRSRRPRGGARAPRREPGAALRQSCRRRRPNGSQAPA